jgi:exodeoxyribonuclease V alpha subunit
MTIHLKCLKDGAINTDVLLVDESSMVDLSTFNMMLNCIQNPDIRICLVGDKSQILPVGIGCVFADMINSHKVPLTELTTVFRYNDNGILYMATNTRQGRYCLEDKNVTHRKDDYTIGGTYHFSEVDGKDIDAKILERVTERYFGLLKRGIRQKDILILSAYNVGECGVDKINDVIQAEVNPPSTAKKEFLIGKHTIIRVGDRVINIKNDYKALTMECYQKLKESDGMLSEEDLEDTTTIFNGQRGVAVDVLDDGKALVCNFDNEIIVFTKMKAKNIKLAYAISYHKSQGQESPYVISVVTPNQSRLLNRNLLYVGQTRGKKEQFDIGSTEAMKNALSIDGVERRDTWLYDLLREDVD